MASNCSGCRMAWVMVNPSSCLISSRAPTSLQVTPGVVLKPSRLQWARSVLHGMAGDPKKTQTCGDVVLEQSKCTPLPTIAWGDAKPASRLADGDHLIDGSPC